MKWIDIKEREPAKGESVIVWDGHDAHVAIFDPDCDMRKYRYDCDEYYVIPTHWCKIIAPI